MATPTTKPDIEADDRGSGIGVPAWPLAPGTESNLPDLEGSDTKPRRLDALQALLAFSTLHDQIRRRKALASRQAVFDGKAPSPEFDPQEQFVLDDVLKLVAERALAITGADGLAIALAENSEIVLRAAAGIVRPDVGARIDRDSAFSGACFRMAQVVNCDDTETDPRVNLQACRKLGARSMVAVPLCGRRRVIGVLEAFSAWPFGFNESDVQNLALLAELVLAALKPEDEDRFAESAQAAEAKLESKAVANTASVVADLAADTPVEKPVATTDSKPVVAEITTQAAAAKVRSEIPGATLAATESKAKPVEAPAIAQASKKEETAAAKPAVAIPAATEESEKKKVVAGKPILVEKPAVVDNKAERNEAAAEEQSVEPALTFGQAEPARSSFRPGMLLIAIVIGVNAAAWGLRRAGERFAG